jgi:hypothetical protein
MWFNNAQFKASFKTLFHVTKRPTPSIFGIVASILFSARIFWMDFSDGEIMSFFVHNKDL